MKHKEEAERYLEYAKDAHKHGGYINQEATKFYIECAKVHAMLATTDLYEIEVPIK